MKKGPYGHYSPELREEAAKMVIEEGIPIAEAARRLSLPESTLRSWSRLYKDGKLEELGTAYESQSEIEEEIQRLKKELHEIKQERDILKKAAAYFAKESLNGTPRSKS